MLWYFTAASFVAIAVVTVVMAVYLNRGARADFIQRSEEQGATEISHTLQMFYYNMLSPQLEDNPNLSIEEAIDPKMMGMFARRSTFGLNIKEISVFDAQGNLVYSTDAAAASLAGDERHLLDRALQGTPSSKLPSGAEISDLGGERRELDAVRSYAAIRETAPDSAEEGAVLGVLRISQDVTDAFAAAQSDAFRNALIASIGAGGALFMILFVIVFRADRIIAAGYRQLGAHQKKLEGEIRERERTEEELKQATTKLEEAGRVEHLLARTDTLTGLPNRRYIEEAMEAECARAARYDQPVCVAMADLDYFKRINDGYGHQTGDDALKFVAGLAREACRTADLVSRWGGDEFVFILPSTNLKNAKRFAERFRQALANSAFSHPKLKKAARMTISLGVAQARPDTFANANLLLERADKALYAAKAAGRNRIMIADGEAAHAA